MKSKFLMFLTLTLILFGMVFGLYWKYIRSAEYPVFLESFDHGVLTVDSLETTGKDNKYKLFWDKDEIITVNINPERTSKAYYNLDKLIVNGEDVTDQVSMLQYRTPVTSKMTILAYFKKGKAPEAVAENTVKGSAKTPVITKYYDNTYVGAYAAYDVEDPAIFADTKSGYYYCFGSDNVVIKSKDMVNWTGRTTYFKTPENANTNAIMDFSQFESVKAWAETHGYDNYYAVSDTNSDRTPLSPDIVKIGDVYYLYYSLSKQAGANESAIFVAKTNDLAKSISEKKWADGGMVICSCGRHAGTEKVTDAEGNRSDQAVTAQYDAANAVHPSVYYDGASLYMVYGGYQGGDTINGGIYLLELDPATGLIKAGSSVNTAGETIGTIHGSDEKTAGTLLARPGTAPALTQGGSSIISAADITYNKDTGYYYLFTTYGVDDTNYNIRVARSESISGPYTDFKGNSMTDTSANQYDRGYMLLGGYSFTSSSKGSVAYTDIGRASVGSPKLMLASNGVWLMASQSQLYYKVGKDIVTGSVIAEKEGITANTEPSLDIRELSWDDTGWPIVMPEIFTGRPASTDTNEEDMYGIWDVLVFDSSADKKDYRAVSRSASQRLSILKQAVISAKDIAGGKELNTKGTLKKEGDCYKLTVDGVEYKLHTRYLWDWELKQGSLIFTGLGADGSTIWGKKNFSSTTGMYTDAFYYLYDMCDDATKAEVDEKVAKISANPSQTHIDVLSEAMIKRIVAAQQEK